MFLTTPATTPAHTAVDLRIRGLLANEPGHFRRGEILVREGRIVAVGAPTATPATQSINVGDAYLLPGMVDGHVHSLSHPGEGIAPATAAAAAGGVTTIVEMPFDHDGPINDVDRLARKQELVRQQAHVDVALLGTVAPGGGWRRIDGMRERGVVGLKVSLFETDSRRFPRIAERELIDVFSAARANELPVCVHAGNDDIVRSLTGRPHEEGDDPLADCRSRPPISASLGLLTALEAACRTRASVHVCHASLPRSVDLVRQYVARGADVSLETCPHYLLLDTTDTDRRGALLKINPPLREPSAREGLWERLIHGDIDVISSDHAPWQLPSTTTDNVFDNHCGVPGVETGYPLVLAEALRRGPAAFDAAVTAMTINPARRFGLGDRKGLLAPGYDADIAVFDPEADTLVDEAALHSHAGWSPYHGVRQRGGISLVIRRGQIVYDGVLRSEPGQGALVDAC